MAIHKTSMHELRRTAAHYRRAGGGSAGAAAGAGGAGAEGDQFRYAPMFLPVDATAKKESGVIQVVTRQKFLDENIDHWLKWRFFKGATLALAVAAVLLLFVNVFLSGAAALGAGYCYGQFRQKDFIVNMLLKHRWLLEGT